MADLSLVKTVFPFKKKKNYLIQFLFLIEYKIIAGSLCSLAGTDGAVLDKWQKQRKHCFE